MQDTDAAIGPLGISVMMFRDPRHVAGEMSCSIGGSTANTAGRDRHTSSTFSAARSCSSACAQARLNAGTVTVHEPVVFASSASPSAMCRGGVLHSSGQPGGRPGPADDSNAHGSVGPDSRAGASPVNRSATEGTACDVSPGQSLQVNMNAGPGGRIDVRTRSWMDGLRARMQVKDVP